ncbi:MAG TPA: MarR family transcriptional regulator [Chloroflexota bacterium]|nr:MarR family transcriptional regulator [Chloroflexota bacterium]
MNDAAPGHNFGDDSALLDAWVAVVTATLRTARVLGEELEAAIGRPMAQAEVLLRIYRSPEGRLPTTRLARELLFTSGGFTKLADRLVGAGLVAREACPTDRRVTYLTLSDEGRELARRALQAHAAGVRRHVLDAMGEETLADWSTAARRLGGHSGTEPGSR